MRDLHDVSFHLKRLHPMRTAEPEIYGVRRLPVAGRRAGVL
jgi:hypothetical protein